MDSETVLSKKKTFKNLEQVLSEISEKGVRKASQRKPRVSFIKATLILILGITKGEDIDGDCHGHHLKV